MKLRPWSLLLFAGLIGCGSAAGETTDTPQPPVQPPVAPPTSTLTPAAPPPLSPLPIPRIVSFGEIRLFKAADPKETKKDIKLQLFFPPDALRPYAGELADVVSPKGYRMTAKVAYVKEEVRFDPSGKPTSVVGYYATLMPIAAVATDIGPKTEQVIALIPSVEERVTRTQAVASPPAESALPEDLKTVVKTLLYADTDGDGEVEVVSGVTKAVKPETEGCRLAYFMEDGAWKERRHVCGKLPDQIHVSTYAPPKPDDKVKIIQ